MLTVIYYEGQDDVVHASGCSDIQKELSKGAELIDFEYDDLRTIKIDLYGDLAGDDYDYETQPDEWLERVNEEASGRLIIRPCAKGK